MASGLPDVAVCVSFHGCICRYCDSHYRRRLEPYALLVLTVTSGKSVGGRGLWPWNEGNQVHGLFGDHTRWPWYVR